MPGSEAEHRNSNQGEGGSSHSLLLLKVAMRQLRRLPARGLPGQPDLPRSRAPGEPEHLPKCWS
jgi:hypothetical protein